MDGNQKNYRLSQRDNQNAINPTVQGSGAKPNLATNLNPTSTPTSTTNQLPTSTKAPNPNESNNKNPLVNSQLKPSQTQQKLLLASNSPITSVSRPSDISNVNDLNSPKKVLDISNSNVKSKKVNIESDETDNEDVTSPFKTSNDMVNLSADENDLRAGMSQSLIYLFLDSYILCV